LNQNQDQKVGCFLIFSTLFADNTADSQDRDPELGDGKSGYTRTQETQPDTGEMNKGKKAAVKSTTADTSTLNGNNGKRAKKEKCCSVKWTIIAILIVVFILAIICAIVGGIGYWQGWFSKSSS
jgi:hypothetical protein